MQVRMMEQVLAPSMQHAQKPISAPRWAGSAAMVRRILGRGAEQDIVDNALFWKAMAAISSGTVKTTWKYWVLGVPPRGQPATARGRVAGTSGDFSRQQEL